MYHEILFIASIGLPTWILMLLIEKNVYKSKFAENQELF